MDNTSKYTLNEGQTIAVNALKQFLDDPYSSEFTLSGIAGSGKTFCLKIALENQSNVFAATVSHAAKTVLDNNFTEAGIRANCFTLAKLLGLTMNIDEDGEIFFASKSNNSNTILPIEIPDVLVIDECSMLGEEQYAMIMSMKKPNCKVIFCGDPYQLPPVDSSLKDSITFKDIKATLHQPVRYTGAIYDLGQRIRQEIDYFDNGEDCSKFVINSWMYEKDMSARTSLVDETGSGYIFLNKIEDAIRISLMFFRDKEHDASSMKLLAYRNATIKKLNEGIRYELFGANAKKYMPGEYVICDGGYGPNMQIYNNQSFVVIDSVDALGPNNVPCVKLVLDPNPRIEDVYVVDWDKGLRSYYDQLNVLKANAKRDPYQWKHFKAFKDNYAVFNYNYAQNAYRCQGATYKNVIVFEEDILSLKKAALKPKLQALYTSCTRAQKIVFIYNKNYRVNNSELPADIKEKFGL